MTNDDQYAYVLNVPPSYLQKTSVWVKQPDGSYRLAKPPVECRICGADGVPYWSGPHSITLCDACVTELNQQPPTKGDQPK